MMRALKKCPISKSVARIFCDSSSNLLSSSGTSGGLKKLKNESFGTCFETVRTAPRALSNKLNNFSYQELRHTKVKQYLMLLLLFDGLDRDILAWLPVDLATGTFEDLRSLERKRLFAVDFATQKVSGSTVSIIELLNRLPAGNLLFGQNRISEVIVGSENKLDSVGEVFIILNFYVRELLQQWLIVRLDHVGQNFRVFKNCQPKVGNSYKNRNRKYSASENHSLITRL